MDDKRRPVLVLSRDVAIPLLASVVVAPITTRVRGIPTEVPLGPDEGMPTECAASLDNVTLTAKATLVRRLTSLSRTKMLSVCRALHVALDC